MKIKLLALEVYHDNEIAQVIPLRDNDDRVSLAYPTKYFSFEDLRAAVAGRSETMQARYYGEYGLGKEHIHFDEEAWYMPCIGKIRVQCQEREIDWPIEHRWIPVKEMAPEYGREVETCVMDISARPTSVTILRRVSWCESWQVPGMQPPLYAGHIPTHWRPK